MDNVEESTLSHVYGPTAMTFHPDVLELLKKHLNLTDDFSRNLVFSSLNSREDNGVKKIVNDSLKAHIEKIVKTNAKITTITIHQNLDPTQQRLLENSFPAFNFTFTSADNNAHGFAAAHRKVEMAVLLDKIGFNKDRDYTRFLSDENYDVYFTDIGSNFPNIYSSGYEHVHCCSPVLSLQDSNRFTNRFNNMFIQLANSTDVTTNTQDKVKQLKQVFTGQMSHSKFFCMSKSQYCTITSPFAVSLHSIYDMTYQDIADTMINKNIRTIVGTFIYTDQILVYDSGTIPGIDVRWEIDREKRNIHFVFNSDASNPYVHTLTNYFKLIVTPVFYSRDQKHKFFIELLENINGVQFFKINRQLYEGEFPETIYHQIPIKYFDDKYRIRFYIRGYDKVSEYFNTLSKILITPNITSDVTSKFKVADVSFKKKCSDLLHASQIKIVSSDTSKLELEFYCSKELVDALLSFALACTESKFKPLEVFAYARSYSARIFVGKSVIHRSKQLDVVKLFNLSHAVYLYVYDLKYNQGKVMQDLIADIDWNRKLENASFLSKCFSFPKFRPIHSTENSSNLGLFDRFEMWLFSKKKSDISTNTFITEARTYVTRELRIRNYFTIKNNITLSLTVPECASELFSEDAKIEFVTNNPLFDSVFQPVQSDAFEEEVLNINGEDFFIVDKRIDRFNLPNEQLLIGLASKYTYLAFDLLDLNNEPSFALSNSFRYTICLSTFKSLYFNEKNKKTYLLFVIYKPKNYLTEIVFPKFCLNTCITLPTKLEAYTNDIRTTKDKHIKVAYEQFMPIIRQSVLFHNALSIEVKTSREMTKITKTFVSTCLESKLMYQPIEKTMLFPKIFSFRTIPGILAFDNLIKNPIIDINSFLNEFVFKFPTLETTKNVLLVLGVLNRQFSKALEEKKMDHYLLSDKNNFTLSEDTQSSYVDFARNIVQFDYTDYDSIMKLRENIKNVRFETIFFSFYSLEVKYVKLRVDLLNCLLCNLKKNGNLLLSVDVDTDNVLFVQLLYYLFLNFADMYLVHSKNISPLSYQFWFYFEGFNFANYYNKFVHRNGENAYLFPNDTLFSKFKDTILKLFADIDDTIYSNLLIKLTSKPEPPTPNNESGAQSESGTDADTIARKAEADDAVNRDNVAESTAKAEEATPKTSNNTEKVSKVEQADCGAAPDNSPSPIKPDPQNISDETTAVGFTSFMPKFKAPLVYDEVTQLPVDHTYVFGKFFSEQIKDRVNASPGTFCSKKSDTYCATTSDTYDTASDNSGLTVTAPSNPQTAFPFSGNVFAPPPFDPNFYSFFKFFEQYQKVITVQPKASSRISPRAEIIEIGDETSVHEANEGAHDAVNTDNDNTVAITPVVDHSTSDTKETDINNSVKQLQTKPTLATQVNTTTVSNSPDNDKENLRQCIITEIGELIKSPYPIAHCISGDIKCSKGVALELRKISDYADVLKKNKKTLALTSVHQVGNIICLVTKNKYYEKPTLRDFESTIKNFALHLQQNNIDSVAIPKLGTGCDKLHWKDVKKILLKQFSPTSVTLHLYLYHPPSKQWCDSSVSTSLSNHSDVNTDVVDEMPCEPEIRKSATDDVATTTVDVILDGRKITFKTTSDVVRLFHPDRRYYRTVLTKSDGWCLIYALTRGLVDIVEIAKYMIDNTNGPSDMLLQELNNGFCGTATMEAYANLFNTNIVVYDGDRSNIYLIKPETTAFNFCEVYYRHAHYQTLIRTCSKCEGKLPVSLGYHSYNVTSYKKLNFNQFVRECLICEVHVQDDLVIPYVAYDLKKHDLKTKFYSNLAVNMIPTFCLIGPPKDTVTRDVEQLIYLHPDKIPGAEGVEVLNADHGYRLDLVIKVDNEGNIVNIKSVHTLIEKFLVSKKIVLYAPLGVNLAPLLNTPTLKSLEYTTEPFGDIAFTWENFAILPNTDVYNSMINSMSEIKHVWYVTENTIAKNLEKIFKEIFPRIEAKDFRKIIVDTSVGLVDLKRREFLWTPTCEYEDINYVYLIESKRFVEVEKIFFSKLALTDVTSNDRYAIFNKSTKMMNEKRLFDSVNRIHIDPQFLNFEVAFVEGVPGAGKTTYIVNKLENTDNLQQVVLTATNESAALIRDRFSEKHHKTEQQSIEAAFILRKKIRTMDSALMDLKRYVGQVRELYVDEALMRHIGQIFWTAYLMRVEKLIICGDSCQIPYFNNEGIVTKFALRDSQYFPDITYLNISHRIPRDVAVFLNSIGKYSVHISTTNKRNRSLNLKIIKDINQVPFDKKKTYLVFSRAEKAEIVQTKKNIGVFKVYTIAEFQGKEADDIHLIRIKEKPNPLYDSFNQFVVAVSRHKVNFTYYTVVKDQLYDLIEKINKMTDAEIKHVSTDKLSGGGRFYNYIVGANANNRFLPRYQSVRQPPDFETILKPDFALNLNTVDPLVADLVLNHSYNGYVHPKPYYKKVMYEFYDTSSALIKVPPPKITNPLVVIQDTIDTVFPGSTLHTTRYDHLIFEQDDLYINSEGFSFVDRFDYYTKKDTISPSLRTSCPAYLPTSNRTVLKAFNERNGCVPTLSGRIEAFSQADRLFQNFVNVFVGDRELYATYTETPMSVNPDTLQEWFESQPPAVYQAIEADSDHSIYHKPLDRYYFILKRLAKPSLDPNPHTKFNSPQTIAFQEKKVNAIFCSLVKDLKARFIAVLRKNFIINTDMSLGDFTNILNHRLKPSEFVKYSNRLEFDISKYDKSQGLDALLFEVNFMKNFGVPDELIATWLLMHTRSRLYNLDTKFAAEVDYQRKSGDAMTFFGNTIYLMAVLATVIDLKHTFGFFSGDDSYILTNQCINKENVVNKMANAYNFEVKLFEYVYPYFCSKFFIPIDDDRWLVVPDLVKLAIKLGRDDLVNWDHVKEYRISLVDLTTSLDDYIYHDVIVDALADRYKTEVSISFVSAIYYIIHDDFHFQQLYYLRRGDKLADYQILPTLDM